MKPLTPLVILEGPNGVGKTTYAKKLSEALAVPMVRPLRQDPGNHWDGAEREVLTSLNVPVNTFVDDIYTADLLVQLGRGAVLDRSMPSALVYWFEQAENGGHTPPSYEHLLWWQQCLSRHPGPVLVVFMEASLDVVKERIGKRAPSARSFGGLSRAFAKLFHHIALPKMVITTSRHPVQAGVDRIVRTLTIKALSDAQTR